MRPPGTSVPDNQHTDLEPYSNDIEKYLLRESPFEDETKSEFEDFLTQQPELREYLDSIRDSQIIPGVLNGKYQVLKLNNSSEKFPGISAIFEKITHNITSGQLRKKPPEIPKTLFKLKEQHSLLCENFKSFILNSMKSENGFNQLIDLLISLIETYGFNRVVRKMGTADMEPNEDASKNLALIYAYATDSVFTKNPGLKYLLILETRDHPLVRKNTPPQSKSDSLSQASKTKNFDSSSKSAFSPRKSSCSAKKEPGALKYSSATILIFPSLLRVIPTSPAALRLRHNNNTTASSLRGSLYIHLSNQVITFSPTNSCL
ncbi:MAG: hypothetical protein GKR77_01255 [Legionellales bacterium]|nr:hypothetical protein [Legionellales bacterium]